MNARQQKVVTRFGQILTFLDANQSSIPANSVVKQRQALTTAVTQIGAFAQDQVVKGTESVSAQAVSSARTALRDIHMRQLSTVALINLTGKHAGDPDVPNAKQIFTLPKTRKNSLTILAAAAGMVAAATPYASIFTEYGVSLDEVSAAIKLLEGARTAAGSAKLVSEGATQGIKAQIRIAREAVQLMDVVIRPKLASSQSLLAQWESIKKAAGGQNLSTPLPVSAPAPAAMHAPETAATPEV